MLPLIPLMVKIVTTIIRGEDKNTGVVYEPKYLDNKVIDQLWLRCIWYLRNWKI
mgnify:CR=1 FL=1